MSLNGMDKSIQNTELWKLLIQKSEAEMPPLEFVEFIGGVNTICAHGITLAKDIIRFFPTFTLHDNVHICNVCDWMYELLGEHAKEITASDAALLVMSAACHDIGMSVSQEQKEHLIFNAKNHATEWEDYFFSHPEESMEFQRTGNISEKILRDFVRRHHHKRIGIQLSQEIDWPKALTENGISRDLLIRLCKSHGEPIEALSLTPSDQRSKKYHLLPCAILLRLADILDFDASRAPKDLYHHLGLDNPKDIETAFSKMEWEKNCTDSCFELVDGTLLFTAACTNLQVEHEIRLYMDWLQKELDECSHALWGKTSYWGDFQPPYKIDVGIQPNGYKSGPFCLTMDQDRILKLLTGKNLYSDPGVFVRELLQNSIDAIWTRIAQDNSFELKDAKIVIHTWTDNDGYSWFRIQDNGTGMDQDIILNHFLKIGNSYYGSARFRAESQRCDAKNRYTPISRFGIGILSCFMSDPKRNKVQLSTKRFAQLGCRETAAIRMNIDGLYGYYYLTEKDPERTESSLLVMNHPPEESPEENCYRSVAGTTICVQLNLYQLGASRTLKELVDRYVQFPEIQVEYHGPEGDFFYLTQQKLMKEVHDLNPNGESCPPKEYYYYISDEEFLRLKEEHPEIIWETNQKPGVILRCYPLDWMTPGNQVSGVSMIAEAIRPKCRVIENLSDDETIVKFNLLYDGDSQYLDLFIEPEFSSGIAAEMGIIEKHSRKNQKQKELLDMYKSATEHPFRLRFRYSELSANYPLMSAFPEFIRKSGWESVESKTIVAFNGVLADQSKFLGVPQDASQLLLGLILLLQQNYRPEVNLSRDTINELPLEAMAGLSILQKKLNLSFTFNANSEAFKPHQFILKTEKEFQVLFDERPDLRDELQLGVLSLPFCDAKKLLEKHKTIFLDRLRRGSFYELLSLAAAKELGAIYEKGYHIFVLQNKANNNVTDNFPAILFFVSDRSDRENKSFVTMGNILFANSFNCEHFFSKWLIRYQKELEEKTPGIYNTLLENMILCTNGNELCKKINEGLKRLQSITGNPFEITNELFLTETDF